MASHELVHRVNECGCAERSQHAAQQARQAELGELRDAASAVARNGLAIAEDEPPAFAARILGNRCEQAVGPLLAERKQGQLLVPVKSGDDPRRPATQPSATGAQQDRAWKAGGRDDVSVDVLRHSDSLRRERFGAPLRR